MSLFTLISLHGLNTSSTAASHSLLVGHSMTKQALPASFVLKKKEKSTWSLFLLWDIIWRPAWERLQEVVWCWNTFTMASCCDAGCVKQRSLCIVSRSLVWVGRVNVISRVWIWIYRNSKIGDIPPVFFLGWRRTLVLSVTSSRRLWSLFIYTLLELTGVWRQWSIPHLFLFILVLFSSYKNAVFWRQNEVTISWCAFESNVWLTRLHLWGD